LPRVQLFPTCLLDTCYPRAGEAVVRVLEHFGVEVRLPAGLTCCGQPAWNAGHRREARVVALHVLEILEQSADPIVVPSGSCGDMIGHQWGELFREDPALHARAEAVAARTYEFSSFLVDVLGVRWSGAIDPRRVYYHPSCHLLRGLKVKEAPLALLAGVRGAEVPPTPAREECCGFGGLFSLKEPVISAAMADRKLADVREAEVAEVVSCDLGCLAHLGGALHRDGSPVRCRHLAELLLESLGQNASGEGRR
jgi:L-lactate dehydrogenase complex protein LldE